MEKVILPPKVAETIESYWSRWSAEAHLKHIKLTDWTAIAERDPKAYEILIAYAREHPIEYMSDLVNGYEVEEEPITITVTPEQQERIRGVLKTVTPEGWKFNHNANDSVYLQRLAIRSVLAAINIKIKGVNEE